MISCVCTSVVGEVLSRSRFSTVTRADLLRRTVPLGVLTRYDRGCGARSTIVSYRSWSRTQTSSPGCSTGNSLAL